MADRRRVALVVSHLLGGGKEECVVNLADALHAAGWRPLVICLETTGPLARRVEQAGVPVVALNKRPGNDLRLPWRLAQVFRRQRVGLVHSHNWGALVESVTAAALARVSGVVHTQHGLDYGSGCRSFARSDGLRMWVKSAAATRLTRIVAVSAEVRDMVVATWHVPEDKVRLIHNGIRLDGTTIDAAHRSRLRRQFGIADDERVIGSVGFFRPVKDFPTLLRALALVVPREPRVRLMLVGDGPLRAELESAAARLGLRDLVHFPGWRDDARALLSAFDLFALPSLSEGLSLSILEAMAAGLPVVTTRVGGNPELVLHRETGLLVAPQCARELAEAVLTLIRDPAQRSAMGTRGRERVRRHFTLERMLSAHEDLYAECRPTT